MLRCILFIPPCHQFEYWRNVCFSYCVARRYAIVAVATTWESAQACLLRGDATVAVVGDRSHLPPDRAPRLEVVTEYGQEPQTAERRRPRRRYGRTSEDQQ